MPESHKAERRRQQKANRAAGIGDEQGRIPARVKDAPIMLKCATCMSEFKVTKTNTELKAHAESKHGVANYEECFPGAEAKRTEVAAKVAGGKGGAAGKQSGETKAERKKKAEYAMDDLLSAGLSAGKKGKGKK